MGVVVEITPLVSSDTVDALAFLLQEARAGRVIGVAYVAMHKTYDFTIDSAGAVLNYPMVALGATSILQSDLVALAKGT